MSSSPPPTDDHVPVRFGTFSGVFRPIVLTVLGALLYLREGWLVGNAGLLGAVLILTSAYVITGTTALSLASLSTNVRVRPGGAFAIISQALGLEAGGAIGIPLYIAQAASSALYLYAFSEAWSYLFPLHDTLIVVAVAFLGLSVVAYRSAEFAFKAQAVMSVLVCLALLSAFLGWFSSPHYTPTLIGNFQSATFFQSFAIFFPAATGIMVGVGMSGSLDNPRKAIPKGTLSAWAFTFVVYLLGAFWYATIAPSHELTIDKTLMIRKSLFGPLVFTGLVSSTLMAALSSMVAAPRLLGAMAEHNLLPGSSWIQKRTHTGHPRNAVLVTMVIAGISLLSGSLDAIAPIITGFFIMVYLVINLVVFLEQRLGMISFRPTFPISKAIPLVGVLSCVTGLMLASPRGGILGVFLIIALYGALMSRQLDTPWETVRSGVMITIAAWGAKLASGLEPSERSWKPDLLIPVRTATEIATLLPLVHVAGAANGAVKFVGIGSDPDLPSRLEQTVANLKRRHFHGNWTTVELATYTSGVIVSMDALRGTFFPPNLVLIDGTRRTEGEIQAIVNHCRTREMGLMLYLPHPTRRAEQAKQINVWVSDRSPDWSLQLHLANLDLPMLMGVMTCNAWSAQLNLVTVLSEETYREDATQFLDRIIDMGRLPTNTQAHVLSGPFHQQLVNAPKADLHIFGLPPFIDLERFRSFSGLTEGACLFLLDSGSESILA